MPTVRLSMRKLREVLRLKFEGALSQAQIGRACGISKGVVSKYIQRAQQAGLSWPLPEELDEAELERLLYPAPASSRCPDQHAVPEFAAIHQALKHKGVRLRLLWQEYRQAHPRDG